MSPSPVRFYLTATLAVALCGSQAIEAQATQVQPASQSSLVAPVYSSSVSLPDAPSASLQQQQTTPPAQQQVPPPVPQNGASPAGTAAPEAPRPGETPEQFKARVHAEAEAQVKKEEGQRNLYILPNFNSVIAGISPPLSPGQKFDLVYHTSKDPYTFAIAFIAAGLGEAEDSHTGYHWGPAGYFRRVGAAYGDNVDGAIWGNAILPIELQVDPRFYRRGPGHSTISRILWSAGTSIYCYGDNGKLQPNYSNIGGNIISGAISNLYYPDDERGIGLVFSNTLTVTAEGALGAQLLEFGPDLTQMLERRRLRHQAFKDAQREAKANGTPAPKFKDIPSPTINKH